MWVGGYFLIIMSMYSIFFFSFFGGGGEPIPHMHSRYSINCLQLTPVFLVEYKR